YWALKTLNFDLDQAGSNRFLQLSELEELRAEAYDNALIHKAKVKKWHDSKILRRTLKPGMQALLFNSRLRLFPGKLKSRWSGPFLIEEVMPYGVIRLIDPTTNKSFQVNGQRVKEYLGNEALINKVDMVRLFEPLDR
ncbi:hypothetical protein, partial [Clostridioides difficile]|uniref:hypothetical protein n=1 Tax=Clostridioides difficile TaxID=1496 RepID=UPI002114EA3F